ncbi:MAG: beta-ketoacyl synthase [Bacteroidales bacterium]|nr:beta-ketoacyl synthase [Bacteroidales bacterium]
MIDRVFIQGTGLCTPLGDAPRDVFASVRRGESALRLHPDAFGAPEPVFASLFDRASFEGKSLFPEICTRAASAAIAESGIDASSERTGLVVCSVKGEIEHLGQADVTLAASARKIADALGVTTSPVVVSNACISGLAGLVQGRRMLLSGLCDQVIVVGAEVQSRFIVTGFQSLKALSGEACKPFDAARCGLNLGEGAAAMVLSGVPADWEIVSGAIRNDANHISGPSRTGEGSFNALQYILPSVNRDNLAFVSVHGTSTLYNDEMESIALDRAGLLDFPVCALKGTFGHTMGAAGILESIMGMLACEAGIVLPTRGYESLGVSRPVKVSSAGMPASGNGFIKLLSGFGGVNGALYFRKGGRA